MWPRLPLRLRVDFSPAGEEYLQGIGMTDNVSAGGMYFHTRDWQLVQEGRSLLITASGMGYNSHVPLSRALSARATVMRLELPTSRDPLQAKAGVAVRFDERPHVGSADLSA